MGRLKDKTMKVHELIEVLKMMPQDAPVLHLWDGEPRTSIEHVWLSKSGCVVTADLDERCYSDDARPVGAPTKKQEMYWITPSMPQKSPCILTRH